MRPHARIVPEMGMAMGAARIDLAVVDHQLIGYEVKGARDTLDRLPRQAGVFAQVFERLTLVAALRHVDGAMAFLPTWWGIELIDDRNRATRVLRRALPNPALSVDAMVRLLWRDEAAQLLAERDARPFRNSRRQLWQELVRTWPEGELATAIKGCLRVRTGWRAAP